MKICDSCQASVPGKLIVKDEYTNPSDCKKRVRHICVLCKHYLPYDHYGVLLCGGSEWRRELRCAIRNFFAQAANAQDRPLPSLPPLR